MVKRLLLVASILLYFAPVQSQKSQHDQVSVIDVGPGWAGNSVNAVVFRKNSLASFKDKQFVAYYDQEGFLILARRKINSKDWTTARTKYRGNVYDAHNSISIAMDGAGYLHVAWDHHNNALRYARSLEPLSLELGEMLTMIGSEEKKVSYPEFYQQPGGGLVFLYRDGGSGNGNLVMNHYDTSTKKWKRLQSNLLDGEGVRNAYWQACIDAKGFIHISWVWRESPDVASNHDMSYAVSRDGGVTWFTSRREKYKLPINIHTAEKAANIPRNSELINQTSMCVDAKGNPVIASYWNGQNEIPQYQIVYKSGKSWKIKDTGFRKTDFSLGGQGTKKIPVSRPQVLTWGRGRNTTVAILFRDDERNNRVSFAVSSIYRNQKWAVLDLNNEDMGQWEPSYDTELWKTGKALHIFLQKVEQADSEAVIKAPAQMVQVMQVGGLTK